MAIKLIKMPKSPAERQRDYRERKRHVQPYVSCVQSNKTNTQAKSAAQRTREYRERKRLAAIASSSAVNLIKFENMTEVCPSPAIYPTGVHEHFTALSTSRYYFIFIFLSTVLMNLNC